MYFFRSNVIYFAQKEPIKVEILRISNAQIKILQIFVIFETARFSSNFASFFSVMRHNSSILFLAEILYTPSKRSLWKYKFGEISREQSKVWNFALQWVPLSKSNKVSQLSLMTLKNDESLKKNWLVVMMNCFVVWLTDERRLALFPGRTTVRDPHHCKSLTHREQGLNLRRTWFQD